MDKHGRLIRFGEDRAYDPEQSGSFGQDGAYLALADSDTSFHPAPIATRQTMEASLSTHGSTSKLDASTAMIQREKYATGLSDPVGLGRLSDNDSSDDESDDEDGDGSGVVGLDAMARDSNITLISPETDMAVSTSIRRHSHSSKSTLTRHESETAGDDVQLSGIPPSSSLTSSSSTTITKQRSRKHKKSPPLTINIVNCKYDVVRDCAIQFGLRTIEDPVNWSVFWIDTGVSIERVLEMKAYQRINHFPGMHEICRKDHLARNLNRLTKLFPRDYNFFPKTWVLPSDWGEFKMSFRPRRGQAFIAKPDHGCQGKGIFLFKEPSQVQDMRTNDIIVQSYLSNPCLIDGFKFDLRVYVLVTSVDPLRVFIYRDGLARLATEPYHPPTEKNMVNTCMHLTNYAINKHSHKFVRDESGGRGSKRTITSVLQQIVQKKRVSVEQVWSRISDVVIKTLVTVQPQLSRGLKSWFPSPEQTHGGSGSTASTNGSGNQTSASFQTGSFPMHQTTELTQDTPSPPTRPDRPLIPFEGLGSPCFEILGFDIFLDAKLKPWVLEVNHSPSFTCDTTLDRDIKSEVILGAFRLLNLCPMLWRRIQKLEKNMSLTRLWKGAVGVGGGGGVGGEMTSSATYAADDAAVKEAPSHLISKGVPKPNAGRHVESNRLSTQASGGTSTTYPVAAPGVDNRQYQYNKSKYTGLVPDMDRGADLDTPSEEDDRESMRDNEGKDNNQVDDDDDFDNDDENDDGYEESQTIYHDKSHLSGESRRETIRGDQSVSVKSSANLSGSIVIPTTHGEEIDGESGQLDDGSNATRGSSSGSSSTNSGGRSRTGAYSDLFVNASMDERKMSSSAHPSKTQMTGSLSQRGSAKGVMSKSRVNMNGQMNSRQDDASSGEFAQTNVRGSKSASLHNRRIPNDEDVAETRIGSAESNVDEVATTRVSSSQTRAPEQVKSQSGKREGASARRVKRSEELRRALEAYRRRYDTDLLDKLREYEDANMGSYQRIFPPNDERQLSVYLRLMAETATWSSETNATKARREFLQLKREKEIEKQRKFDDWKQRRQRNAPHVQAKVSTSLDKALMAWRRTLAAGNGTGRVGIGSMRMREPLPHEIGTDRLDQQIQYHSKRMPAYFQQQQQPPQPPPPLPPTLAQMQMHMMSLSKSTTRLSHGRSGDAGGNGMMKQLAPLKVKDMNESFKGSWELTRRSTWHGAADHGGSMRMFGGGSAGFSGSAAGFGTRGWTGMGVGPGSATAAAAIPPLAMPLPAFPLPAVGWRRTGGTGRG